MSRLAPPIVARVKVQFYERTFAFNSASTKNWIRLILLLALAGLNSSTANAQDKPIAEVTGVYQFSHLQLSEAGTSASTNVPLGWDASLNIPVSQWLGVVGDFGRIWKNESALFNVYGTSVSVSGTASIYTYGGGPQLTYRKGNIQPFVRCIFGDAHSTGSASINSTAGNFAGSASTDSFFVAPGGGADFRIAHNFFLRGGADYLRTSKNGVTLNGIRAFAGVTYTFGAREKTSGQRHRQKSPELGPTSAASFRVAALGILAAQGQNSGAEITEVMTDNVAAKAGLQAGDIINSVDGKSITTPSELAAELAGRAPAAKVRLGYLLHGRWQSEMIVVLGNQ